MKYKLLVLDVDGTLVNNQKEITPRTLSTLLKVQQMGVHIVLASGRPTNGVVPLANKLELNRYGGFILSYNGGQIINAQTGELLFEKRIAPEWIPYFEKKARKNGFALFTYHKDFILTTNPDNPHVVEEGRLNGMQIIGVDNFTEAVDFAPCKCMLVSDDEEALVGLETHWKKRLDGVLEAFRSEPYFLEGGTAVHRQGKHTERLVDDARRETGRGHCHRRRRLRRPRCCSWQGWASRWATRSIRSRFASTRPRSVMRKTVWHWPSKNCS